MTETGICEECGGAIKFHECVNLAHDEGSRVLCYACYNGFISRRLEMDFEHPNFVPLSMEDAAGMSHQFEFRTMLSANGLTIRAIERRDDGKEGHEVMVVGDPEGDSMFLFKRLLDKMGCELRRKHVVDSDLGLQIGKDNVVRARITWDNRYEGMVPLVVIDGREVAWNEFGRMLMTFEGWKFKLEIFEPHEER